MRRILLIHAKHADGQLTALQRKTERFPGK